MSEGAVPRLSQFGQMLDQIADRIGHLQVEAKPHLDRAAEATELGKKFLSVAGQQIDYRFCRGCQGSEGHGQQIDLCLQSTEHTLAGGNMPALRTDRCRLVVADECTEGTRCDPIHRLFGDAFRYVDAQTVSLRNGVDIQAHVSPAVEVHVSPRCGGSGSSVVIERFIAYDRV